MPLRSLATLLALLAAAFALPAPPGPVTPGNPYPNLRRAVVRVSARESGQGTGWVADVRKRLVVTCAHVVGDATEVRLLFPTAVDARHPLAESEAGLRKSGHSVRGKVLRRDDDTDLALIEAESLPLGTAALPLASSSPPPGSRVHLVGCRYDASVLWVYGTGRVRAVHALKPGYFSGGRRLAKGARVLAADLPFNEGDSGGPVVDDAGEIVGVAAAVAWELQGAGLCIAADGVRKLLGGKAATAEAKATSATENVVIVEYDGGERRAGVVVDAARGLVLTTATAVAGQTRAWVTGPVTQKDGTVVDASWYRLQRDALARRGVRQLALVVATDARRNLALLEAAKFPESMREVGGLDGAIPAKPGESVSLVSHPRRTNLVFLHAAGVVRQRSRQSLSEDDAEAAGVLILQAPLGAGEEGGPVLDAKGRLVGLVTGKVGPQQQLVFALDADEVHGFLAAQKAWRSPTGAAGHLARAAVYERLSDHRRALSALLASRVADGPTLTATARARNRLGEYDKALADVVAAKKIGPATMELFGEEATALVGLRKLSEATRAAEAAVRLSPKSPRALLARAEVRLAAGKNDEAFADADDAVWADATLGAAYRVRGAVQAKRGETAKAVADLTRAVGVDATDRAALLLRASLVRGTDEAAARADYSEVLRNFPDDADALAGRGRLRLARGDAEGLGDVEAALRVDGRHGEALWARGSERMKRGRRADGAADWVAAIGAGRAREVLAEADRSSGEGEAWEGLLRKIVEAARKVAPTEAVTKALSAKDPRAAIRRAVAEWGEP